jgi:hypothetical protein
VSPAQEEWKSARLGVNCPKNINNRVRRELRIIV